MSEEQEMAIRGRLMTDYTAAKERKVLLQRERERIAKDFNYIGGCLISEFPETSSDVAGRLESLNVQETVELLAETKANNESYRDLRKKLTDLGFPV